ncbi:hypothetical protein LJR078_003670 [Arthrobacter sp. LjRoot78]|uniref:hypothetical protein n=1 Tax=Arthrobacter sp. LjRoot78 TaxID=3342338 RepID=UPI003ECD70AB
MKKRLLVAEARAGRINNPAAPRRQGAGEGQPAGKAGTGGAGRSATEHHRA